MPSRPSIVLASASPRRRELLRNAGIDFEIQPANIPEEPFADEAPIAFAERMAREKARVVLARDSSRAVLAADTVVSLGRLILGKPVDTDDAMRMLELLSGQRHLVTTAVCLVANGFEDVRSENTAVDFAPLTADDVRNYVRTGEPMDKAGAYAIQGLASRWITKIEGDYHNVVGLPVDLVWRMLRERNLL